MLDLARTRPLLVFLAAALVFAACGSDDDGGDTAKTVTETESVTRPETTGTTTTSTEPVADCSAADLDGGLLPQADLPAPVAKTREELFDAARACDFDALQAIAARNEDGFAFSFGDQGGSAAEYWRTADPTDDVMRRIVQLLNVEYVDTRDDGPRTFAWPSAHGSTRTDATWKALADSNAYTSAQVAAFRADDMYFGLRIGILPDGRVTYIVAGD